MIPLSGLAAVPRVSRVTGRLRVPGDKSISHRYAMLAAIADGASRLHGYAPGADCAATLACLAALGVRIERGPALTIHGLGTGGLRPAAAPLDAANSGTSMRLLAGLLAAHPFRSVIGGDPSLSRRPMTRVIEPLTRMGAGMSAVDGHPPLTIDGAHLKAIRARRQTRVVHGPLGRRVAPAIAIVGAIKPVLIAQRFAEPGREAEEINLHLAFAGPQRQARDVALSEV